MFFDRQARENVEAELGPDESLLWFGKPNAFRIALKAYPFFLIGVPAAAISGFLTAQWIDGPMSHLLTATPPDTVGMGLTLLVFWIITIAALQTPVSVYLTARSTTYVLSSIRILIIRERPQRSVLAFEREEIEQVVCREYKNASGDRTIAFKRSRADRDEAAAKEIKMVGILRVRSVERLMISVASPLSMRTPASSTVG